MNVGPILRAMKQNRIRVTLLILEIAMTLAIVTNCVNVILAERAKMNRTSGFDDANLLWIRARPFAEEFQQDAFFNEMVDADLRRLQAIPGVQAAANTHLQLYEGGGSGTAVKVVGSPAPRQATQTYYATRDIFKTLGAKIIAGRGFIDGDHRVGPENDEPRVVVISKSMADALFPNDNPIGKSIVEANARGEAEGDPVTVVGVFERFFNPYGQNPDRWFGVADRAIFRPARVGGFRSGMRYFVRVEPGAMKSVMAAVEKAMVQGHPGRVIDFRPTLEQKASWFSASRLTVFVMTGLIVALVFVTALGILGITAMSVSERTKQIGTRRALGATRGDILRHFLVENWLTTTAGLAIGVIGAYVLNFLLVSQLTDAKMPWQLVVGGMVVLWMSGLLATLPPALRATNVPPSIATRSV